MREALFLRRNPWRFERRCDFPDAAPSVPANKGGRVIWASKWGADAAGMPHCPAAVPGIGFAIVRD
jgi:hypothetical protein